MENDPVAYAYEYEEFNGQWMRAVILAKDGASGHLHAPPMAHHGKAVRNVRPLYER